MSTLRFESHPERAVSPIDLHYTMGLRPGDPWPVGTNSTHSAWRFGQRLQVVALQRAAAEIARRHAILRCAIRHHDGGWRFVAEQAPEFEFHSLDAGSYGSDALTMGIELLREVLWRPFRLEDEAPFRTAAVRISDQDHLIGFVIHKAYAEAESVRIFSTELASLYDAYVQDQASPLQALPIQYMDYMISMEEWRESPLAQSALEYWLEYLDGANGLQHSRGTEQGVELALPGDLSKSLRELGHRTGFRDHLLWEAIHHIALSRISGRHDVTTLSVARGRKQKELQGLIGSFVNLLPHRSRLSKHSTCLDLLRGITEMRRASSRHSDMPCNLLAAHSSLMFSGLPHFNLMPSTMMPHGWFRSHLSLSDNERMSACIADRNPIPPPNNLPLLSISPQTTNPYLYTPYVLFVIDGAEFTLVCQGDICRPFTPVELVDSVQLVARAVAADPDRELAGLL